MKSNIALVFGVSGDQGQSVAAGLLATGIYQKVYGVTRDVSKHHAEAISNHMSVPVNIDVQTEKNDDKHVTFSTDKHVTLIDADLNSSSSLRRVFARTRATVIFLVTTTDVPTEDSAVGSFHESEELEYESIKTFFDVLVEVQKKEWSEAGSDEKLERHVVFSTYCNVRGLVEWLEFHKSDIEVESDDLISMKPLDDGGIVPHYSGKGRGGEYALKLIHGIPDPWKDPPTQDTIKSPWMSSVSPTPTIIPGLTVTNITLPFLHTNFALSAAPLPTTSSEGRATQWSISACLGDSSHPLDMFSVSDLKYIVPTLFEQYEKYQGRTIKLSGEKIAMDQVAYLFSDLFGKDVIYSPLTLEEMSLLDIPEVPAFAQMCQYLASSYADHDLEETKTLMSASGREPQTFNDWLLSHSDEEAFEKVGLNSDASPIQVVTVFNALSLQGTSVIKGLLADARKQYMIRACVDNGQDYPSHPQELAEKAARIQSLDLERVSIHYADLDDVASCTRALEGADGAFIVTLFKHPHQQLPNDPEREEQEERLARLVIDACAASGSVKHLVLSTMEPADDVEHELKDDSSTSSALLDIKTRLAAYARVKHMSMTYVILPLYSEQFFHALAKQICNENDTEDGDVPMDDNKEGGTTDAGSSERVVCMSVESLGPAVANIFDSYEVYSGHEIGLVTDILSVREATEIVQQVFFVSQPHTRSSIDAGTEESSVSSTDYGLDIVAQDLGQIFRFYSRLDWVKQRDSIAKTMELVPDAKPFKRWLEENRDNVEFREMLGLR